MTSKLTRERIEQYANDPRMCNINDEIRELARIALAEMDSVPVATLDVQSGRPDGKKFALVYSSAAHKLHDDVYYLHTAPQAPVMPGGLHPDTQRLVADFCSALAEKLYKAQLKYGYDADWKQDGWPGQCQAHFHQHIAKGDPRDVAAYCAFMWYHGWKTEAAQPAPAVQDYFASLVAAARIRADKAMRKFPQPNYVLNKVAEESGEVIKAVIHYTEGREEWSNVEYEIIDNLAMLLRLVKEGDQVIGFTPPDSCRAAMLQAGNDEIGSWSNGKGTPTVTSITPAAPDKKLTDDVLDEIIAGAKTSMEQYLALSLKAERKVWRQEGPTDDERIMAIEGIHSCERCGDEGWVVGEMGITRCACGQAGNSPVIPDGYVMVPKEPTEAMMLHKSGCQHHAWDDPDCAMRQTCRLIWSHMLAAAPQLPGSEPATVPDRWIPVSERMPDDDDFVYIWPRPDFGVELHVGQYCECSPKGDGWYAQVYEQNYGIEWYPITVTHWMPLPADPQEEK